MCCSRPATPTSAGSAPDTFRTPSSSSSSRTNLRGLTKIVRDIRAEGTGPRKQNIDLHFVVSNVPDLDDEDPVLHQMLSNFQTDLGFANPPLRIHRYDSLSVLNQTIFTKDRQGSRLAQEYQALTSEIDRFD